MSHIEKAAPRSEFDPVPTLTCWDGDRLRDVGWVAGEPFAGRHSGPSIPERVNRSGRRDLMRRVLILVTMAVVLTSAQERLKAFHVAKQEKHELKKRHKEEKRILKRRQRAMKSVMNQHEQSSDESERFKHDLKMQRQLLRKDQKDETQNLKKRDTFVRQSHPSS